MKRIVFSKGKGFTRVPEYDFSDDGNVFHFYLYKGLVPVTKFMYNTSGYKDDNIYVDYRLDYLGYPYDDYKDLDGRNKYNGAPKSKFNMEDFQAIGDAIIARFGKENLLYRAGKYIACIEHKG